MFASHKQASQPLTAVVVLVAAVATVVSSITHPAFGNATVVATLKLGGRAELI